MHNDCLAARGHFQSLDTELRQRLLGTAILISAAIPIIPILLKTERPMLNTEPRPPSSVVVLSFASERLPEDAGPNEGDAIAPKPDCQKPERATSESRSEWYVQVDLSENADNAKDLRATARGGLPGRPALGEQHPAARTRPNPAPPMQEVRTERPAARRCPGRWTRRGSAAAPGRSAPNSAAAASGR